MRKPPYLHKGSKIYLVAPSFGCTTEPYLTRLEVSIKNLKKMGYEVIEGPNIHLEDGVAASTSAKARAKEIMDAFASDADLILSVGGGETMCEILPYIDFEKIKNLPPKWFMGFSDNTNLTATIAMLSDTMTVYGPCAPQFFMKKIRLSELDGLRMLSGEKHFEGYPKYSITKSNKERPLWTYRLTQPKIITPHKFKAPVEGTLFGGCMDCLINICGTKYDKVAEFNAAHPEGIIWFLEACDLNPLSLRRACFQLKEAGWFQNAKAILFGRPLCLNAEIMEINRFNACLDILQDLNIPILFDIDLGHISPSMPIMTGAKAKVSLVKGNVIFDYLD